MDEQNSPSTEPATTTPDPVVNTPAVEPQQAEVVQAPAEIAPVPETTQTVAPSEPIAETPTAQMAGSEPLPAPTFEPTPSAGATTEAPQPETPTPLQIQQGTAQPKPAPTPASAPVSLPAQGPQEPLPFSKTDDRQENLVAPTETPRNILMLLLTKARLVTQLRKHKKLAKIMNLFAKKSHITNDDVEKLLHVSDATATRYLSELEKQNKITQTGKTGHAVTYTKR